ncbi:hypothetical protein SAMN04487895_101637 [Paenibacillus sophorae]|uniref:Uncharacterized protein n=1 Tax=Paenibacillus sophorae TaxID=1333845 RepID=A0A1H8GTV8_9BACL|nr:hypothetical protein [Paenibacillus sophorae]QWU14335.1 hypothetical protein KP014_20730 [Paenibacillus sophorae]SEN47219.1 hypothetical protein SAMN04487895_101637 [Paenibacillus sophorae]
MELQPTYGYFEAIGIVTGLSSTKSVTEGEKEDCQWKRLQFGIKVSHNAFVYVELMGMKTSRVKVYEAYGNREDNKYIMVDWNELNKFITKKYKIPNMIKININDEPSDLVQMSYDAITYLNSNLNDGDTILIRGTTKIEDYNGEIQEKFTIKSIYSYDPINFDDKKYFISAYFSQEVIFVGFEQIDKNKYSLFGKIVIKESSGFRAIPYNFIVYKSGDNTELIDYLSNKIHFGSLIKVYGNIRHYVPITTNDEGQRVVVGTSIKELVVTGGSVLESEKYSKEDLEPRTITGSPFEEDNEVIKEGFNKFGF